MKNFSHLIKSKLFLVFLVLSLISIVYLFYSSNRNKPLTPPETAPTPTPSSDIKPKQPAFNKIKSYQVNLNINTSSSPQTLAVYEAQPETEDINDIAQQIVKFFNLQPDPKQKNVWTLNNYSQALFIDYSTQYLNYHDTRKNYKFTNSLDQSLAIKTAQNFIKKYFSSLDLIIIEPNIINIYVKSTDQDAEITTKGNANAYMIPFAKKINNLPYYFGSNLIDTLSIYISPGNTVSKITYKSQPLPKLSNAREFNLITKDKIEEHLELGDGEIGYIDLMQTPYDSNSLPEININKYFLEYRYNEIKRMVIPYFRFPGTFVSTISGAQTEVTIILPAVEL